MKKIVCCFLILGVLCGCAAPLGEKFKPITSLSDETLIYYYRPGKFLGSGVYYEIKENGRFITKLYNGSYYPSVTTPGQKTISAGSATVSFFAEPGKTYFIRGKEHMGLVVYHPSIKLVPNDKAWREIQTCRIVEEGK